MELYNSNFLQSVRYAESSGSYYICGRVAAEMRKKVIYQVDIVLDRYGIIEKSQCECAAGQGPEAHCKHIVIVYYSLTKVKEGVLTELTCTDTLQTFHQTKKYTGSPVKMEDIKLRQSRTLSELKNFDPRPEIYKNNESYPGLFRTVWLNSSAKNVPIRHLYSPANMYGVNHDHSYCEFSNEEVFLRNVGISGKLSTDRVNQIAKSTRGQSSNKKWKEERLHRLQASSFGRIVKRTERTDSKKLAKQLTEYREIIAESLKHGKKYEEVAVTDYELCKNTKVTTTGIVVSKELPHLGCSPDGLVGNSGVIEVKCPYTARHLKISPVTVQYLSLDDNQNITLRKTHDYYYQIMGTLFCTGRQWADLVVWTLKDMKIIRLERDESFMKTLTEKLTAFYDQYFRQAVLEKFYFKDTQILSSKYKY